MNPRKLKQWACENKSLAMDVCKATAIDRLESARVRAYVVPIFERYEFTDHNGERITDRDRLYLCGELDGPKVASFYAECDAAHRSHGFSGEAGYCPASITEHLRLDAEKALLLSLGKAMDVGEKFLLPKARDQALNLALSLCVNS